MKLLFFIVSHFLASSEMKIAVGNTYKKHSTKYNDFAASIPNHFMKSIDT